jgi:hypothetical protein
MDFAIWSFISSSAADWLRIETWQGIKGLLSLGGAEQRHSLGTLEKSTLRLNVFF